MFGINKRKKQIKKLKSNIKDLYLEIHKLKNPFIYEISNEVIIENNKFIIIDRTINEDRYVKNKYYNWYVLISLELKDKEGIEEKHLKELIENNA